MTHNDMQSSTNVASVPYSGCKISRIIHSYYRDKYRTDLEKILAAVRKWKHANTTAVHKILKMLLAAAPDRFYHRHF